MTNDRPYHVQFTSTDMMSAQRMRFLNSSRLKIIGAIWALIALFIAVRSLFPQLLPDIPYLTVPNLAWLTAVLALVIAAFYLLAPWIEFTQNPLWRNTFMIQLKDRQLMLMMEGKPKGVFIEWERITRLEENDRAYILYMGAESNFLILPKNVFPDPAAQARFRSLLKSKSRLSEKVKARL